MSDLNTMMKADRSAALSSVNRQLASFGEGGIPTMLTALAASEDGRFGGIDFNPLLENLERGPMAKANAMARFLRANSRSAKTFPTQKELAKDNPALAKAVLDVGFNTNYATMTGPQSLGYLSLDTRLFRGTIRPNSFTLYNHLNKTRANQVVDYWPYAEAIGGAPVGAAYQAFSTQTQTVPTNVGKYNLNNITLKLAVDGRAMTLALAQQNSFVNMADQETANAALAILQSVDWALYWGNPTLYSAQPLGFAQQIPARNITQFQTYYNTVGVAAGLSPEQAMFNLIYEKAGTLSGFRNYGQITHAFMTPQAAAGMQSLVTAKLDMFVASTNTPETRAIVVNGDLQGMNTRFGPIQFPIDMMISARDIPLASIVYIDGTTPATSSGPTPPASVTIATNAAPVTGSQFTAAYAGKYVYAVASANASMMESTLVTVANGTAVAANGSLALTITPPVAADATVFRVFRSGLGYTGTDPNKFRWIGDIAANGASPVVFTDLNAYLPGSENIFLFDMDENDSAIDYRYLLPLTKIDLYTSALFMPWAVAHIGAPRLTVPKFHGMIQGYVPTNPDWNPLTPNV